MLTPTLELLEKTHPRLPANFFHLFAGSLNKWIRVYDYRDAEERVAMLHEWVEGEADEDQYEIPNVEGCIPPSLKQRPLSNRSLGRIRSQAKGENVKAILDGVLDLERISEQAKRSELTDEMREEMSDMNPPLPGLLAVFRPEDAIEGCFDEEAQTMTELPPEPSVIIPLIADQQPSVQEAFHTLRIVCETLATASRLIDRMPGNEQWVVQQEETMDAQVRVGANRNFVLQQALLIYGGGSGAFATLHEVRGEKEGAPYLGPGQSDRKSVV